MAAKPGRPRRAESLRRSSDLLARLAAGEPILAAADAAGVKHSRVLRLLDEPEFQAAFVQGIYDRLVRSRLLASAA